MENLQTFEIVFMPKQYARFMPSSIMTEPSGRTVRIATNFKSRRWLGIMLAHELGHVEDQIVHGEDSTNRDEYNAGEVRSHLLENKLLRFWDTRTYDYFIDKAIPVYKEAYMTNDKANLKKLIAKLYPVEEPSVSHYESNLAYASCFIAVAFEDALRKGASLKDLANVYVDVGDRFMKKSNQ